MYSIRGIGHLESLILFGKRMIKKRKNMGEEKFNVWRGSYIPYVTGSETFGRYVFLAENDTLALLIYAQQPLLSVKGLCKEVQKAKETWM